MISQRRLRDFMIDEKGSMTREERKARQSMGEINEKQVHIPERRARCQIRYSLQLPVSVTVGGKEVQARSVDISRGGILLSSAFLILEGSTLRVAVPYAQFTDSGRFVSVRGKVLRVQPMATGRFTVAIKLEHPLELPVMGPESMGPEATMVSWLMDNGSSRTQETAMLRP
jgi:hypothetical protein